MNPEPRFVEAPRVEWHGAVPFAFARLDADYALRLERSAHEHLPSILSLPAQPWLTEGPDRSQAGARYSDYNVFLLGEEFLPLFVAVRETYRTLLAEMDSSPVGRFIKCWYNVTPAGEGIHRHTHKAPFIGTFAAHAEGSVTHFGTHPETGSSDHQVINRDGQIMITVGMGHHHHAGPWHDRDRPRVTYAFDIVSARSWRPDRIQVPFDGQLG